jgi:hypothetical protein
MAGGPRRLGATAAIVVALGGLVGGGASPAIAGGQAYGAVESAADLDRIFAAIRADVAVAETRADLTRLYRRAGYLVTLTYSRPWRTRFGDGLPALRKESEHEFAATAQAINRRAAEIGTEPDYADRRPGR